jgi:hypothetical protein
MIHRTGLVAWVFDIPFPGTGVPNLRENAIPLDPTVRLYLGSWGGSSGRGRVFVGKVTR